MKLYLDMVGGISGDMTLAGLIGLGADIDKFHASMNSLSIASEFEIEIGTALKGAIGGVKVDVIEKSAGHVHRNLNDINEIIMSSGISKKAKALSKSIFYELAVAEASVHLAKVEDVHFHEVGAVDSIVDIIGCAVLIDLLNIDEVYYRSVPLGQGFTMSQHGKIPLPAPATLKLLEGMTVSFNDTKAETVTPTGAAILKGLSAKKLDNRAINIIKSSTGCGTKDFDIPNILRCILFEEDQKSWGLDEKLLVLECNLDDITGEVLSDASERLMESGALDVWNTPIFMKKGRPAYMLSVLTDLEKAESLRKIIFEHTTTLGIREYHIDRKSLKRKIEKVETGLGPVNVKKAYIGKKQIKQKIEFEDLKIISRNKEIPIKKLKGTVRDSSLHSE